MAAAGQSVTDGRRKFRYSYRGVVLVQRCETHRAALASFRAVLARRQQLVLIWSRWAVIFQNRRAVLIQQ